MSGLVASAVVSLPTSPFPPPAAGFMGLGTGYLIYGLWLMYLMFATILNAVFGYTLPV